MKTIYQNGFFFIIIKCILNSPHLFSDAQKINSGLCGDLAFSLFRVCGAALMQRKQFARPTQHRRPFGVRIKRAQTNSHFSYNISIFSPIIERVGKIFFSFAKLEKGVCNSVCIVYTHMNQFNHKNVFFFFVVVFPQGNLSVCQKENRSIDWRDMRVYTRVRCACLRTHK